MVDQPERRQTEQPENHHRGQGHGAAVHRTAQGCDRRRLNLAKNARSMKNPQENLRLTNHRFGCTSRQS